MTDWLDADQQDAWKRLIAVVELLPGVLDSQLRRDADLTHFEYFLLAMLSEAPERTLRMTGLASRTNATLPAPLPRRTPARGPRPGRTVPLSGGRPRHQRTSHRDGVGQGRRDGAGPRRQRSPARDRRADPEADRAAGGDRRGHPRAHRPPRHHVTRTHPDGEVREPMTSEEAPEEARPVGDAGRGARGEEPRTGAHPGPARHRVGRGRGARGVHRSRRRSRDPGAHRTVALRPDPQGRTTRARCRLGPSARRPRRARAPCPRRRRRGPRARPRRPRRRRDLPAPGGRSRARGRGTRRPGDGAPDCG